MEAMVNGERLNVEGFTPLFNNADADSAWPAQEFWHAGRVAIEQVSRETGATVPIRSCKVVSQAKFSSDALSEIGETFGERLATEKANGAFVDGKTRRKVDLGRVVALSKAEPNARGCQVNVLFMVDLDKALAVAEFKERPGQDCGTVLSKESSE
ncbi:hypothetical protein [Pacificoceanicola onchidii]|uniref:hypothetical protein n=1 Tax=Pacificoceanicola onchidii TaxID=2562685 RepID=UPI0010A6347D|nr:hypothetical protein [Pacificoceanicola onchidii]